MTLTPLFLQYNAVNSVIFSIQRRYGHFFRLNAVNNAVFHFTLVNAPIVPVKRRQRH